MPAEPHQREQMPVAAMDTFSHTLPPWLSEALAGMPDTIWAAAVSAFVTAALMARLRRRRAGADPDGVAGAEDEATACEFLVNGATVRPLTGAARSLLDGIAGRQAPLLALTRYLECDCPTFREDLEGLVLFGAAFRRHCQRADGTSYEVVGRPRGGTALLSIQAATQEARALDEAERALAIARGESAFQQEALDRAPVLVWTLAPGGHVTWANAGYRERFEPAGEGAAQRPLNMVAHLLEEVPLTARGDGETRRRVKISCASDGGPHWFEVAQSQLASGETLCFAVEVDDLVAAEASLRRFVETLTETFAHLPIGLAVFDKNRRLGLFNPALSDLVKIDAVWLAGRPSLRDFLERLRETRQMPEQKDFAAFRRMLTTLEEGAREGTYEENWVLPSGKIFRVTGRPHPQGALAFLFEDISTSIQLERRYRAELELSQATLDRMSEAIAVFDTSGMLVFVNSSFETLWQIDAMERLEGPGVVELSAEWEKRCLPSGLWEDLRTFSTGAERRTSWTGSAAMRDGRALTVLVAPLPNGSTLVTFREQAAPTLPAGPLPVQSRLEAALAELETPAEAAVAALGAAIAAAPNARAFGGLTQAAQALRDGLSRARALYTRRDLCGAASADAPLDAGNAAPVRLADRLAQLLAKRGLAVGAVIEHAAPAGGRSHGATRTDQERAAQVLEVLATALGGLAAGGASVDLTMDEGCDALSLSVQLCPTVGVGDTEPPGIVLARRRLAALGAELEVDAKEESLSLAARFAVPRPTAATG